MKSPFSVYAWHRVAFAAFGLVSMAILRRAELAIGDISSWAEISAWVLFLMGFWWAMNLETRFELMVKRLFRRGAISIPGDDADSFLVAIESRARNGARFGAIGIPLILILVYLWIKWDECLGYDFYLKIALEIVAAVLAGGLGGRIVIYGFFGAWLKKQNPKVRVKLGHPDEAGGLAVIGRFFLYQAGLVMLPVMFFGFWWAVGPAWPIESCETSDFLKWRNPFALFFLLLLGLEIFAFLAPMSFFHREMLSHGADCGREADEIGDAVLHLDEEMATASDRTELESLKLRRQLLQSRFDLLESAPVWPIDHRIRHLFTWGNASVILAPFFAKLPFMPSLIQDTVSNLLGLADLSRMKSDGMMQLRQEFVVDGGISPGDFDFLASACCDPAPDLQRLRRLLRRRQLGEPREYVVGFQEFRGRRFTIDKRVYITDPELTHLVDTVVAHGRAFLENEGRPPLIVEFGVGCGSLAISVKKELPEARVIGLDLDGDAIAVAGLNASLHHADLWLAESDLFSGLPDELVPDIIFGDPPWGDDNSLYDDERPASHYHAMPPLSAFPSGGITGLHEAILGDVGERTWKSKILLNLGILEAQHVTRLGAMTASHEVLRFDKASILLCNL